MVLKRIKLPILIFIYTTVILAALLCICTLYHKNTNLELELHKWQDEASELRNELDKIERYTEVYQTSPEIVAAVIRESERYGVNIAIMLELIHAESDFNPQVISRDGAKGLCQIKPATAKYLSRELNIAYSKESLFDTGYNIRLGTYYLSKLLNEHKLDYHKALTAYNRGSKGLEIYMMKKGTAVSSYSRKIETNSLQLATKIAN